MQETRDSLLPAADVFSSWKESIFMRERRVVYRISNHPELASIEIAPKQIALFGGAPGNGKTAFTMQATVDALRLEKNLRALVCNIEMPPEVLLDRQLSRISGIPLAAIRDRTLDQTHEERLDIAFAAMSEFIPRLYFVPAPYTLKRVAEAGSRLGFSDLLMVLDYIQQIEPPKADKLDRRSKVDAAMNYVRLMADEGAAIVVVSSVGRQKNSQGRNSYDNDDLTLASFKESGGLEFAADNAFIIGPTKVPGRVILKHLKARHSEPKDVELTFNGSVQSFSPVKSQTPSNATGSFATEAG